MFIKALKNSLAASGSLFILLVTAKILLQAGATSSTSFDCEAEEQACGATDDSCIVCYAGSGNSTEYDECIESYFDEDDDETDYCDYTVSCCLASSWESDDTIDCMGSNAWVELQSCLKSLYSVVAYGGGECPPMTCSDGGEGGVVDGAGGADNDAQDSSVAQTGSAGRSSPSSMLTLALALVFLTAALS